MDTVSNLNQLDVPNDNHINRPKPISHLQNDQFKATRIWNEVLHAFYIGIELKKHRRQMKIYYDCFTASEAITWLKSYLRSNSNFNVNKITRFQALNLLRKYYNSRIIERVNSVKNDLEINDNGELFRFTVDANENLPFLLTSKSDDDLLKSCSMDLEFNHEIELDLREKIDIYKRVIWSQMNRFLYNISDYLECAKIDGLTVMNNINRINLNGVVQLTDKNEDLPNWILSAMKCLANWPSATGSGNCLPKYPGFEYDVFKLIKEYFVNFEEPIIPYLYYHIFLDVYELYVKALLSSRKKTVSASYSNNSSIINHELGLPANCVYETVFSSKDPVTKIVPIDELSNIFPNLLEYFKQTTLKENLISQISLPMNVSRTSLPIVSTIPRHSTKKKYSIDYCSNLPQLFFESSQKNSKYIQNNSVNFQQYYSFSNRKGDLNIISELPSNIKTSSTLVDHYYELLQLLLLLLPSPNRRYLQLLIRLFYKMIRNKELCILTTDSFALKENLINIFTRCIIRSEQEKDFDEFKSKSFLGFILDECMEIFKVPNNFSTELDKMMKEFKKQKNIIRKNDENINNNYCQKITNNEYEFQRDTLSDVALSDLLQNIMDNDLMSQRDKLKWIKQFKLYHPDVYDIYFGNKNLDNQKIKQTCSLGPQTLPLIKQKHDLIKRFISIKF